jgi:hypothetical protein
MNAPFGKIATPATRHAELPYHEVKRERFVDQVKALAGVA